MEVSFQVDKIVKCATYNTVFFYSGGDDVLIRLSIFKQIIKDVNLMCIAFSVIDILGIVNEFIKYVQIYIQYLYIAM